MVKSGTYKIRKLIMLDYPTYKKIKDYAKFNGMTIVGVIRVLTRDLQKEKK
jgi:hypothetical protein